MDALRKNSNYVASPVLYKQHQPIEMIELKDQHPQPLLDGQQETADEKSKDQLVISWEPKDGALNTNY